MRLIQRTPKPPLRGNRDLRGATPLSELESTPKPLPACELGARPIFPHTPCTKVLSMLGIILNTVRAWVLAHYNLKKWDEILSASGMSAVSLKSDKPSTSF